MSESLTSIDDTSQSKQQLQPARSHFIVGILIVIGVAVSWSGATQFSRRALNIDAKVFYAPYFMVWFSTNFMILCYPAYIIFASIYRIKSFAQINRESLSILAASDSVINARSILTRVVPFVVLWIIANYTYSQALGYLPASETTAVFSSNPAFVCICGWILLRDRFDIIRIVAIVLAAVGICLMAYDSGLNSFTFIGILLAVVASITAAIYKVLFKRICGDASIGQVAMFMSVLGIMNAIVNCIPTFILILTKAETIKWQMIPWWSICGSAVLALVFNFLINFGIALTHPLFISIGIFLGMPFNAAIDILFWHLPLSIFIICGSTLILLSFLILIISPICRKQQSTRTVVVKSFGTTDNCENTHFQI